LDPNYVEALNGLGVAYGRSGRYAEAVEAFRSALASGPGAAHVLNNLGYAQMRLGRLHEAASALARSIELDPSNGRTRENLDLLALARERATMARAPAPASALAQAPALAPQAPSQAVQAPAADVVAAGSVTLEPADSHVMVGVPVAGQPPATGPALSMAPSLPTHSAPVQANPAEPAPSPETSVERTLAPSAPPDVAEGDTASAAGAEPALSMAPAGVPPSVDGPLAQAAEVEPVRAPSIEVAARQAPARPADWSAALTSAARSMAAATLDESARTTSYEVVLAKSNDGVLVQLAPNLYELKHVAPAPRVAAAAGQGGAPSLAAVDGLEVSNGVGLPRLASRTARQLSRFGADVARVSDWRSFGQQRTEIHYRAGHVAGARAVQARLPVEAKLVRGGPMRAGVNVRLVVGRDMVAGTLARWYEGTEVARA